MGIFDGLDVAVSGMRAERRRMDVIATNIANAQTIGPDGPYNRRTVVFEEVLGGERGAAGGPDGGGVRVGKVIEDTKSEHPKVFMPGHPNADAEGFVRLPNVNVMFELVDLAIARRSYIANLEVFRSFRSMIQETIRNMGAR